VAAHGVVVVGYKLLVLLEAFKSLHVIRLLSQSLGIDFTPSSLTHMMPNVAIIFMQSAKDAWTMRIHVQSRSALLEQRVLCSLGPVAPVSEK
jgi:hypothetical protein